MRMKTLYAALAGAFLLGTAALAPAQTTAPAGSDLRHPIKNAEVAMSLEYRADKERIDADYKTAKANCKSLSANAKDICMAEAKSNEKVAKAELAMKQKDTAGPRLSGAVVPVSRKYVSGPPR